MRTVGVKLTADVAAYMANIRRAGIATKEFGGELDKAAKNGAVDHITTATAGLGIGLLGVAATAVKFSMDFEKSMSAVSAATHASAAEIAQLRQAAIAAGQATQFSATQAADGITELSKAGVSTADILGGGLKGALDLAAAGQLDVKEAAETAASALTQFKLAGSQVPHVADLLAAGAGKAQGSVHDMGAALNQSGLIASQFGLSIEDTTGALAEFASAGLLGSDAGTSFKTMLLAIANPTKASKSLMDDLGISFYDANGNFVGISRSAQILQERLRTLTAEQRQQALGQIFGSDAIRAASILYADGSTGVDKWAKSVNDAGYAQDTAAKLTDNLAGDLERLKGSLETLAIQSGGGATDGLRKLTQGANGAVDAFSSLPHWVQSTVTVLSGVGGVTLLAAAGFLKARGTAKDFLEQLGEMGPRGQAAATGLSRVAGVAGKLGVAGAAAVGLYEGFKLFGDWLDHFTAPTVRNVDAMTDSLKAFGDTGKVTGELAKAFGGDLAGLNRDLDTLATSQAKIAKLSSFPQSVYAGRGGGAAPNAADLSKLKEQAAQAKANVSALDQALAQTATNGGASQARITFQRLAAQFGVTIDELPQYKAAAAGAAQANTGLAKGFGDASSNATTMANSLEDAISAGQKLTDVWDQLNGSLLNTDKANLSAKQAIDGVAASFKENGKAIDGNSEKALKNRVAVGSAARAAAEAAQAKYEETGSVDAANKTYDRYIGQLRKSLTQAGLNKGQVDKLLGAYAKMPPTVATNIAQPGMTDALTKTQDLWKKLQGVDGNWVAKLTTKGYSKVANDLRHLLAAQQALKDNTSVNEANRELGHFFASGGPVVGPGTATSDSISARLSAGEHVWTADEVDAIGGQGAMLKLRRAVKSGKRVEYGDETPGFAGGGAVTMPFPTNVKGTKIPQMSFPGPGGGMTYKWIESVVRAAFPGMRVISDYRPGAVTLTGNRSYHSIGRAVDFPPSKPLAEWVNAKYMGATRELITPWNSLNIHNGKRHTYTGAVWNQHNFAGGNAHDHWAMAHGGTIREPVYGIGASGDSYSFGENYQPETVVPGIAQSGGSAAGGSVTYVSVGAPVINVNGSSYSPQQIAAEVNRKLGYQIDQYARGAF